MKTDVKTQWVEALRSDKYEQGIGGLCIEDTLCCLGVLCEITPGIRRKSNGSEVAFSYGSQDEWRTGYLPEPLSLEIELTEEQQRILTKLNDGDRLNFHQIADYIEKEL